MAKDYLSMHRQVTDVSSKTIFGLYFLLWITTTIYAFIFGNFDIMSVLRTEFKPNIDEIIKIIYIQRYELLVRIFLCLFLSAFYIGFVKFCPKLFIFLSIPFGVLIKFIQIVILTLMLAFFALPIVALYLAVSVSVIYGFTKIPIDLISKVISDSTRFIIKYIWKYPYSLMTSIIFHCLILLVNVLFLIIFAFLMNICNIEGRVSVFTGFLIGIHAIGVLWINLFMTDTLHFVLSVAFVLHYKTQNKNLLTGSAIRAHILLALRAHFGTICHGSSIMSIIRQIKTIFSYDASDATQKSGKGILCISGCYLIFPPRIFTLFTYIMTVLEGNDFYESAKKSYDLVMKNSLKFIVFTYVNQFIISLGYVIVAGSLILTYIDEVPIDHVKVATVGFSLFCIIFTMHSIFFVLNSAMSCAVICNFHNENESIDNLSSTNEFINVL